MTLFLKIINKLIFLIIIILNLKIILLLLFQHKSKDFID